MKRSVTIFILIALLLFTGAYCLKLRRENKQVRQIALQHDLEVVEWRNKAGKSQARAKVLEADISLVKEFYAEWVDSLKHELDIRPNKLTNITEVATVTVREIKVPVHDTVYVKDSIVFNAQAFEYSDEWAKVTGTINEKEVTIDLQTSDSLSIVQYRDRKSIFSKEYLVTEAVNHNPYATLTGLQQWQEPIKPKRIGIGIGAGYDPFQNRVTINLGVHYSFLQF